VTDQTEKRLIIPYGVARLSAANLPFAPRVEIDLAARTPLRLGDGPYRRALITEEALAVAQDEVQDGAPDDNAARLEVLRRLHLRDCDVFDKHLRRWLGLYFDFVAAHVRDHADELRALAPTPAATFDPILWSLAALRPLPRAHIPLDDDAHVAVDVALWDGTTLIVLVFAGGEHARGVARLGELARCVIVDPPEAGSEPAVIAEHLGAAATYFWRGMVVPPDPFRPQPLRVGATVRPAF